ncbi:MAG: sigma-70 family RNA polymerase sigma factor [Verrucomicrobiaceae bacterium]|nr:sigma-70 family RNA polymerase sigma factor [Verrucomicrobiaceae bacterium]
MPATSPFEPLPDDDLVHVRRAQAGDLDAFDELVRRHQSIITAMLHRFAGNRADLEDMVQETFVRAWRSLGGWKPDKPFVHWLKRIAANMGLEFCRKHQRTPFARLVERDDEHDPLENLPHTPAQRDLGEAQFLLSHLPPDDRALLTLLHLDEMPLAEIATHFGWSRVKAKVKAFRARQRLKTILTQHGYSLT